MTGRLPEKLYRIGEIMEHTGISRQTLHFYSTIGLINERRRTQSGYRLFPPSVFFDLERIRALKKRGKTLREIRGLVESRSASRKKTAGIERPQPKIKGTEDLSPSPRADRTDRTDRNDTD